MKECCKESLDSIIKYCKKQIKKQGDLWKKATFNINFRSKIDMKDSQYQDVIDFIRRDKK